MAHVDFITKMHSRTTRNYLDRVNGYPQGRASEVARRFGEEYWDGDRRFGYGGYRYDGRWLPVAQEMAAHYRIESGMRVLDVGCGKAHLLHEFTRAVPGVEVAGIDVSEYGLAHAPEPVRPYLRRGSASDLPYPDRHFDLVLSINALHNLKVYELEPALREIERVGRGGKYIVVESYRNIDEMINLLYWQLTCECFYWPDEWEWWFERCGYTGDHSFIFFESAEPPLPESGCPRGAEPPLTR